MYSIKFRGQTNRVTTPTHAGLRGCHWPRPRHAPRLAELAHFFSLILPMILTFNPQRAIAHSHDLYMSKKSSSTVSRFRNVQTNGQKDGHDQLHYPSR